MSDKVAIVTGSSSGIGEETAKLFLEKGYQVVITGSNPDKIAKVLASSKGLSPKGFEPLSVVVDFRQPENVDVILEKTLAKFGRLDVLVNNAGTMIKTQTTAANSYDEYKNLMAINVDSTIRLSVLALPHLKKTKGNIINVASVAAFKAFDNNYAYCTSKAAMTMFGRCLAIDAAPEVRVNNVLPGPVATPLVSAMGLTEDLLRKVGAASCLVQRVGESHEIAKAIAYLASDDASFITGTDFVIDGGFVQKPSLLTSQLAKQQ